MSPKKQLRLSQAEREAVQQLCDQASWDRLSRYRVDELLERFGIAPDTRYRSARLARILELLHRAGLNVNTSYGDPIFLSSSDRTKKAPRPARRRASPLTLLDGPTWRGALTRQGAVLEPGAEYRVLSVHGPWAWAIVFAGKDVENRSWETRYRGPILIHASSRRYTGHNLDQARRLIARCARWPLERVPIDFPTSTILGAVDVRDCGSRSRSPWAEPGATHWTLSNPRPLATPQQDVHGKLNLWRWTAG